MAAVLYDKSADGALAWITLNRPAVLNAYDVTMRDGLYEALLAVRDDPEVRVAILRGNGRAFCTGGDLREFGSAPSPATARETRWRRDVWGTLWSLPKITVAAVHGLVVGGGFEMVLFCDLCVASADARFWLPETSLGMIPGVGGTQTLPRYLGVGRGLDLVLGGAKLDAHAAQRLGIVSQVVPRRRLEAAVRLRAQRLARLAPDRVAAMKRAVNGGLDLSLEQGLQLERRVGVLGA